MRRFVFTLMFLVALVGSRAQLAVGAPLTAGDGEEKPATPHFDAHRAFDYIRTQVDFGPRNPGSRGHAACLKWLKEQLRARAHDLSVQAFQLEDPYSEGTLSLTNLTASFHPERRRRIALAAHWDTRPRADREPSGAVEIPIPGANDGGSGVAVLLEMAKILQENPLRELGVDLLFFDGEDYGREGDTAYYLLGSRHYVDAFPDYRPEALILLDMVAGKNLSISMELNGLRSAGDLSFTVFSKAAALGLGAFVSVPGRAILDDHIPFLLNGVACVDLIDLEYRQWHTLQDDLSACSVKSLQQVGDLMVALLYQEFDVGD